MLYKKRFQLSMFQHVERQFTNTSLTIPLDSSQQEKDEWKTLEMDKLKIQFSFDLYTQFSYENLRLKPQFIDRSDLILLLIKKCRQCILINQPRRSGKTTNLHMIKSFFEKTPQSLQQSLLKEQNKELVGEQKSQSDEPIQNEEDRRRAVFFGGKFQTQEGNYIQLEPLQIAKNKGLIDPLKYFGKFPVLYIDMSLLNVTKTNINHFEEAKLVFISKLFRQHEYLQNKMSDSIQQQFQLHISKKINSSEAELSLNFLCECIKNHFNEQVVIIVDEYDRLTNKLMEHPDISFSQIEDISSSISTMINMIGKGNPDVYYLIINGIFDSLVREGNSGFNDLVVFDLANSDTHGFYGISEEEVKDKLTKMLDPLQNNIEAKKIMLLNQIKKNYNGYIGADGSQYNIWSVLSYLDYISKTAAKKNELIEMPLSFWTQTGSNDILLRWLSGFHKLSESDEELQQKIIEILKGFERTLDFDVRTQIYQYYSPILNINKEKMFSKLLLNSGYITVVNQKSGKVSFKCPNQEVQQNFYTLIHSYKKNLIGQEKNSQLERALMNGDVQQVNKILSEIIMDVFAVRDTTLQSEKEASYQKFMLGFLCTLENYFVQEECQSGTGYADIIMYPRDKELNIPIILEFKAVPIKYQDKLEEKANFSIDQIIDKQYPSIIKQHGYTKFISYAIVFSGKKVLVKKCIC